MNTPHYLRAADWYDLPHTGPVALAGVEARAKSPAYRGVPACPVGDHFRVLGVERGLIAKNDTPEAFAPIVKLRRDVFVVGGLALLAQQRRLISPPSGALPFKGSGCPYGVNGI